MIQTSFLEENYFKEMQTHLFSNDFPWYFHNSVAYEGEKDFVFAHILYYNKPNSDYYKLIVLPILDKLKVKEDKLIRAKVNGYTRNDTPIKHEIHTDFEKQHEVCLLGMNTNNGYTEFEDGKKFQSIENSAIIFNGKIKHRSVTQTDERLRVNININYER
tara:strand:- start:944 stop:1423 length:480 start_codon:yes stop_codon:yes gene_type:complete